MKRLVIFIYLVLCGTFLSHSQDTKFLSEFTFGNRSIGYQHYIGYNLSKEWSINNVTLFDTEYNNDNNNMFFIRNMLSYVINKSFKANVAFGVKNPGGFNTITLQYALNTQNFSLNYNIGTTYQNGFTLEQSLIIDYSKRINTSYEFFTRLFTVMNTNLKYLDRGIQQLRIGITKEGLQISLAINLDQFKKAEKTLKNFGIAIKYNF